MKIKKLSLTNFCQLKTLGINFHDELTIIASHNDLNKTAILEAITIALGTFVGAFHLGKDTKIVPNLDEQRYPIIIDACFNDPKLAISRKLIGPKNRTTIKEASELTAYGKDLMDQVSHLDKVALPVMAYYGPDRIWKNHKNMVRKALITSRTMGYEDCFSLRSGFKQVQQWVIKATYAVLQQESLKNYHHGLSKQLGGIKTTVNQVLAKEGWDSFHCDLERTEMVMHHDNHGIVPITLLDSTVRFIASLSVDLAWRCAKLNPHLGSAASSQTTGIVLIDSIDMYLYPDWFGAIKALQDTFKLIQFIVTTNTSHMPSTIQSHNILHIT